MDTLSTPPNLPSNSSNSKKKKPYRYFFLIILFFLLSLAGAVFYITTTEQGTLTFFRSGETLSKGAFHFRTLQGSLLKGVRLYDVDYKNKEQHIKLDSFEGRWEVTAFPRQLNIEYLRFGNITIDQLAPKPPSSPLQLPKNLHLPLDVMLQEGSVKKIIIVNKNKITEYSNIFLGVEVNTQRHHVMLTNIKSPFGTLKADITIGTTKPFNLDGKATLLQEYQKNLYIVDTTMKGSLETITIDAKMSGENLIGHAILVATPFNKIPLKSVIADIKNFNPKLFVNGLPNADLNIKANIQPKELTANLSANQSQLSIVGNININNKKPGVWDKNLFPVETISADINLSEKNYDASNMKVKLFEGAMIDGKCALKSIETEHKKTGLQGEVLLHVTDLNLKSLHSTLITSKLKGITTVKIEPDKQNILLNLEGAGFANEQGSAELLKAEANIEADPQKIVFNKVLLSDTQKNGAVAYFDMKGNYLLNAAADYNFQGKIKSFNPSHWVNGLAKKNKEKMNVPDAKINSEFEMAGHMHPQLYTKAKLNVFDSTYNHMPLLAKGQFEVKDKRLLQSQLNFMIAGNTLALQGSWGNKDDELNLELNAPALSKVGLGFSGLFIADAKIKGGLSQPTINAHVKVDKFSFDNYQISKLTAKVNIITQLKNGQLVPEQSRMDTDVTVEGYHSAGININKLGLNLNGSYASHKLNGYVQGDVKAKPVALTIGLQGSLQGQEKAQSWQGKVNTLKDLGWSKFNLLSPVGVIVSPNRLLLTATRWNVLNTLFELKEFSYDNGYMHTAGAVNNLQINNVLALQQEFSSEATPIESDLIIDSAWDISLKEISSGYFWLKRQKGDIVVKRPQGKVALGLSDLDARVDIFKEKINLKANIKATKAGVLSIQGQTALPYRNKVFAVLPESQVTGELHFVADQLRPIGAFIDPTMIIDGRAEIIGNITGTIAKPHLVGNIKGNQLSIMLLDQGIQLNKGVLDIGLDEKNIYLRQAEFYGGGGKLNASGKIVLGEKNPAISALLKADRFQMYADPQRNLILSGEAHIKNANEKFYLDGLFNIDKGLFDLPKKSAPQLGDDVIIVSRDKNQKEALKPQDKMKKMAKSPVAKFPLYMNLQVNMGDNFRFKGADADLKLVGDMKVLSEPGSIMQGFGTIRVEDGTYEVFGKKLEIERGLINFQGALDNPYIDIIAMRRNQEVEAGVNITGTPRRLRAQLISEPNVSDEEKISWLMLGHGMESAEMGQRQALGAALGFLANSGSKKIAQGVGLDELSVKSNSSSQGEQYVVSLGKAISDRFYVGYEQSLDGVTTVVKATWKLSRRWSVVLKAGVINSLDLSFDKRFDNGKDLF